MIKYFALVCHMISICSLRNVESCQNSLKDDGSGECCTNFFRDGNICKECPRGYFGFNCSEICPELYYGPLCSLKCGNCTNCNHVYGCTLSTEPIKSDVSRKGSSNTRPAISIMSTMAAVHTTDVPENQSSITVLIGGNKTENESSSLVFLNGPPKLNIAIIIYTSGSLISFIILLIIVREIRLFCKTSAPPTIKNKSHNSDFVENIFSQVSDVIDDIILREEIDPSMLNVNSYDKDGASKNSEGDCKGCIYSTIFREKEETDEPTLSLQTSWFEASNTLGLCTNKEKTTFKNDYSDQQHEIAFHQSSASEKHREILSSECLQTSSEFNGRDLEIAMSERNQDTSPFVQFVLVNETTEITAQLVEIRKFFALIIQFILNLKYFFHIRSSSKSINWYNFRLEKNGSEACCFNFYRDGDICKDCPPGYFGSNCSLICPEPYYGHFCGLKCRNCTICHHIYGCTQSTEQIKSDVLRKGSSTIRPVTAIKPFLPSNNTSEVIESSSMVSLYGNKTPPKSNLAIIIYTTGSLISFLILLIIVREILNFYKLSVSPTNEKKPHNSDVEDNIYSEVSDVIDCVISRRDITSSMFNVNSNEQDGVSEILEGDSKDCTYSTVFREKEETGEPKLSLQTSGLEARNSLDLCANKENITFINDCPDQHNEINLHQISTKESNEEIISPESLQSSTEFKGRKIEISMSDSSQDTRLSPTFVQLVLVNETTETTPRSTVQ
ncbi:uncharacterized protein LOC134257199 [Saccostrea cucullata]|uniref:uncharacterized protein LOC134257199 n=1 Tax=Saccostrea cuccullata TaxID=36930 RepID=UPI002ED2F599